MTSFKPTAARCAALIAPLALLLMAGQVLAAASTADVPAASAGAPAAAGSGAQWRQQTLKFSYDGITTLYTCDGLEDKVRVILLAFGASNDVKVRATGCDRGMNLPTRFAWVEANYSALVPAAADATGTGMVKGNWTPIQIAPNRPSFMGAGECELIESMRDALAKGFTLRNVQYRTSCMPHQVTLGSYTVSAEVLKAEVPAKH